MVKIVEFECEENNVVCRKFLHTTFFSSLHVLFANAYIKYRHCQKTHDKTWDVSEAHEIGR